MESYYSILVALSFNLLDLLTGIVTAVKNKDIQSSKLRDGLFKKFGFILCYFLAWMIDTKGVYVGFQLGVKVLPAVVLYSCGTELVSILENICKLNPDLMKEKLYDMFHIKKG
jgi:toxin secretion/phage lysis holin|nr:MAG TPA: holin [Caudoviricetes sp.]